MSNLISTKPWPTSDVIYIDRADIAGQDDFEPGVYILNHDPVSGSRDYCRAGTQLLQDPDLGAKVLEGIDEIISWYEVDMGALYDLFEGALDDFEEGDPS